MLKAVVENLEGIDKSFHGEYKQGSDGKYYLELEGVDAHPSTAPLASTMKNVKSELTRTKADLTQYKTRAEELENEINGLREGAIPKADMEAYKRSHETKYTKDIGERDAKINALSSTVERLMVDDVAKTIANGIAAKPEYVEVLLPHIRGRLKLDHDSEGNPQTIVLDKEGKPSASSLEDLTKEVLSNKGFAPILRGSHASGGSASGGSDRSSGAGKKTIDVSKFDMSKATAAEIVAFRKQQAGQS